MQENPTLISCGRRSACQCTPLARSFGGMQRFIGVFACVAVLASIAAISFLGGRFYGVGSVALLVAIAGFFAFWKSAAE
jgi:hypothetical protein